MFKLDTFKATSRVAAFGALVQSIFAIPDGPTLANLYSHLSPGSLAKMPIHNPSTRRPKDQRNMSLVTSLGRLSWHFRRRSVMRFSPRLLADLDAGNSCVRTRSRRLNFPDRREQTV